MSAVRDFLGNEITPGATVVYAAAHEGAATLRKRRAFETAVRSSPCVMRSTPYSLLNRDRKRLALFGDQEDQNFTRLSAAETLRRMDLPGRGVPRISPLQRDRAFTVHLQDIGTLQHIDQLVPRMPMLASRLQAESLP
jgi:hypothetical protein